MRVRIALTLFLALLLGILAAPAGAQTPLPDPGSAASAYVVAHPRAGIITVFDSAAESFLRLALTDENAPFRPPGNSKHVDLAADYEAVLLPLTAGYARFELSAWLLRGDERELLASDEARVVAFGPAKRSGRLLLRLKLQPGLHHIGLGATTKARAVGVADWTVDTDTADLWVLVPPTSAGPRPSPEPPLPPAALEAAGGALSRLSVATDPEPKPDPAFPVGGLYVGSQRGLASPTIPGAVNFEKGVNATILAHVGEEVQVWSDYEMWWAEGASGDGRMALAVRSHNTAGAEGDTLGHDVAEAESEGGPLLAHGALKVGLSFEAPGTYKLVALLSSRMRLEDMVTSDEDVVAFTVRVVGEPTGAIAGEVVGEDGAALEGVLVEALPPDGHAVAATHTNPNGAYVLDGLRPGSYLVHAIPEDANYLGEWWKDSPTRRGASPVDVVPGRISGGIDFALTPGGTIAGQVVNAAGKAIGGIDITVGIFPIPVGAPSPPSVPGDDMATRAWRTRTNDDGFYSVDKLPAGSYWVRASDPEGRYLTEYFDDAPTLSEADPVAVEAGGVADGIDFALAAGGAITGQVTAQTELTVIIPLPEILVVAVDPEDPTHIVGRAVTNRGGHYTIGGLLPGAYFVRASDPDGRFLAEWFEEAPRVEDADRVPVEPGRVTADIDFTLEAAEGDPRLYIRPPLVGLRAGDSGRFALAVADVDNLAAFEVEMEWNPEVFKVTDVKLTDYLASTGREVIPVEPVIDNEAGTLHFGAATVGHQPGPSGDGDLAVILIEAKDPGETAVELSSTVLTDPGANAIDHAIGDGRVHVGRCMRGDFDCNCVIDIRDVMAVVLRWGAKEGDPDYAPEFDLDSDGDIDIVDVQIEASLWGRRCDVEPEPGLPGEAATVDAARAPWPVIGPEAPSVPTGARLSLRASPLEARLGQEVTVVVNVEEAVDLAGFDLTVAYDDTRLVFVDAVLGGLIAGSERTFVALGPSAEAGVAHLGAYSFPGAPTPSGSGELAILTFVVAGQGPAQVSAEARLVDSTGGSGPAAGGDAAIEGMPGNGSVFIPYAEGGSRAR